MVKSEKYLQGLDYFRNKEIDDSNLIDA